MSNAQHPLITEWYEAERCRPRCEEIDGTRVVMGFPLWGEAYVRRFLDFMWPSIRANARPLSAARADFVLYVDEPSRKMLPAGLHMRVIPHDVMQLVRSDPGYKYALLTAVHKILIQRAARKGAGFNAGTADVVYSERFFERLLELGRTHDAIANLALIVSGERAAPELADRRAAGVLSLSARDLGSLGWRNISGLMGSWLVGSLEQPPASHVLLWRGQSAIHIRCPHLTPIWLNPARCRAIPVDLGDTLDGNPAYLGENFYVPTESDEMTVLTLDDTRDAPAIPVSFDMWRDGIRQFDGCMAQFRARCMVPITPDGLGLPEEAIDRQFQQLMQRLEAQ